MLYVQRHMSVRTSSACRAPSIRTGDLVLVHRPLGRKGGAEKRPPKYQDTCEALKQLGPLIFQVRDITPVYHHSRPIFIAHLADLKPYVYIGTLSLPSQCGNRAVRQLMHSARFYAIQVDLEPQLIQVLSITCTVCREPHRDA